MDNLYGHPLGDHSGGRQLSERNLCLAAWGIIVSKEWVNLKDQEPRDQDAWCTEKVQSAVELYRQAENVNHMCQLIMDALATSDSDWQDRPSIEEYLKLLSEGRMFFHKKDPDGRDTMLGSFGTLLLSVEKLVRHPEASLVEREKLRKQRGYCFEDFFSDVSGLYHDPPKELDFWKANLPSLLSFLGWLTATFRKDPMATENPLVLRLLQELLDKLPSGKDSSLMSPETWTEFNRVRSAIANPLSVLESTIEAGKGQRNDEGCGGTHGSTE